MDTSFSDSGNETASKRRGGVFRPHKTHDILSFDELDKLPLDVQEEIQNSKFSMQAATQLFKSYNSIKNAIEEYKQQIIHSLQTSNPKLPQIDTNKLFDQVMQ